MNKLFSALLATTFLLGIAAPVAAGWSDFDPTNRNSHIRRGAREVDPTNVNNGIRRRIKICNRSSFSRINYMMGTRNASIRRGYCTIWTVAAPYGVVKFDASTAYLFKN